MGNLLSNKSESKEDVPKDLVFGSHLVLPIEHYDRVQNFPEDHMMVVHLKFGEPIEIRYTWASDGDEMMRSVARQLKVLRRSAAHAPKKVEAAGDTPATTAPPSTSA
jgi:hypothetical protein